MIHNDSFDINWINDVAKKHQKSDPILIEKVIRALYLLELLSKSELNFVFKGGTALMLMLPEPKRLSIDIDIIIPNKPKNLDAIFQKIIEDSDFINYEEDERKTTSTIEKAHYKFYYTPTTNTRSGTEYILLDILYQKSHYGKDVQQTKIKSPFLKLSGKITEVTTPKTEAILGDKLTAFAPETTGVQYGKGKEIEIIKQLFDIGHLFDMVSDIKIVSDVFEKFAKTELNYRDLSSLSHSDVLDDIIKTAMNISTSGHTDPDNYGELLSGVNRIKNFIFSEKFQIEKAKVLAAKTAYMASIIKSKTSIINRFNNPKEIADWVIEQPSETKLNKLKISSPEAFFIGITH
jgi:predicted nucleotidyltransferase component of viral defense system